MVRVGKFTGTKAVKKEGQTQGGSVTDKLRSCFKNLVIDGQEVCAFIVHSVSF